MQVVDDSEFGDLEALNVISKLYFEGLIYEVKKDEHAEEDEEVAVAAHRDLSVEGLAQRARSARVAVAHDDADARGVRRGPACRDLRRLDADAHRSPAAWSARCGRRRRMRSCRRRHPLLTESEIAGGKTERPEAGHRADAQGRAPDVTAAETYATARTHAGASPHRSRLVAKIGAAAARGRTAWRQAVLPG